MFNVSDKVVCVAANRHPKAHPLPSGSSAPEIGRVYVVRDIWIEELAVEGVLIQLCGYPEVIHARLNRRCGFNPSRFRKLSEVQAENELARTITANLPAHTKSPDQRA